MKVKIRTESFDPSCPTPEEIEIMEDVLYADMPKEERKKYSENERKWLSDHKTEDSVSCSFPSSKHVIPIGINSKTAFGINAKDGYVKALIESEKLQFFKAWKSNLLRSKNVEQYEYRLKKFIIPIDPNLKPIAEKILRDEELLNFKKNLVPKNEEEYEPRDDSAVQTISVEDIEKPKEEEEGDVYIVYYNNYHTKGVWKPSKISCKSKHMPSVAICEKYILLAYYATEFIVAVKLFDMNYKQKTEWFCKASGPLKTTVNSYGWMVVSDGCVAFQKRDGLTYQHVIENQIITTVHIADDDFLFLGTYNGQVYDLNLKTIRSYSKTLDATPILSIYTSGSSVLAQTISNILTSDSKMFNMVRPLTSIIKGTFVISLTKYGRVKIFSKIHENVVVEYKPPADKTIFVDHVLPWYSNGIFFNGETLAVLYPDGTVVKKSIYLKPLKK